jgi:hypothetical protein
MKNKISTVPILYNAGSYGTFVEWCLNYFSGQIESELPFNATGNSHKFGGNNLLTVQGWRNYVASDQDYRLVRFHPKTAQSDSVELVLAEVLQHVDRAIVLYCDEDLFALNINNKFEKVYPHGWLNEHQSMFVDSLKKWQHSSLEHMQTWQLREFLSYYIVAQHRDELALDYLSSYHDPRVAKVNIKLLFTDFADTVCKLLDFVDLPCTRNDFERVHQAWIAVQAHRDKDQLIHSIVTSVVDNQPLEWNNLSIVDEAMVQMHLRVLHKLELKCYNLDVFPTNTNELKKLLVHV